MMGRGTLRHTIALQQINNEHGAGLEWSCMHLSVTEGDSQARSNVAMGSRSSGIIHATGHPTGQDSRSARLARLPSASSPSLVPAARWQSLF